MITDSINHEYYIWWLKIYSLETTVNWIDQFTYSLQTMES